jgi:hypothetical protein
MPERIQLKRTKGWRKPEGAAVVARPSKWGNPWRVIKMKSGGYGYQGRGETSWSADDDQPWTRAQASVMAAQRYRDLMTSPWTGRVQDNNSIAANRIRAELRGKDLACWCPLDQSCHADVLLEVANS